MRLARAGTVVVLAVLAAACDRTRTGETVTQDAAANCTRCHGYPPPANGPFLMPTTTAHPASSDCHLCHPGTVEADNVTIIPASAGGLHMDGVVEATGGHAAGYVTQHGPDALAFLGGTGTLDCTACHGTDFAGGSSGKSCTGCHTTSTSLPAPGFADWQTNCTFCHGTRTAGVTDATGNLPAPPVAVDRSTTPAKVGAHQAHLAQGTYAAALPCTSCHAVPTAPATPLVAGQQHFKGSGAQAAITFSPLARQGVTTPAYAGGSCAVYCHGSGSGVSGGQNTTPAWTSTGLACDACHGLPPSTGPSLGNPPQPAHAFHMALGSVACADCHLGYTGTGPDPVNRTTHVNGTRDVVVLRASDSAQVTITGWDCNGCHTAKAVPFASHPVPYTTHTADALSGIAACTGCHGADYGGDLGGRAPSCASCHADATTYPALAPGFPDWKTNCTFCHGTRTASVTGATNQAAPPVAVNRSTTPSKVGAHQAHLTTGQFSNALPCSTCHVVPTDPLGHFAGYSGGQAPITFDALATHYDPAAAYAGAGGSCTVYCHGSGTVGTDTTTVKYAWPGGSVAADKTIRWDATTGVTCTSCHGNPPPTGQHALHVTSTSGPLLHCATCHNGYTSTSVDKTMHPNGVRDVIVLLPSGSTYRIPISPAGSTAPGTYWNCNACHNANPVKL